MNDDHTIHVPVEGIVVERVGDETLILDTAKDRIHQLNSTAAYIWNLLDGTRTAGDIARMLSSEFAVDLETASRDVQATLQTLASFEVLKSRTGT